MNKSPKASDGGAARRSRGQGERGLALYSGKAHLRLWLIAAAGLTLDRASKVWAIGSLGDPGQGRSQLRALIEGVVSLRTVHNTGAVAGMASGKTGLLILASALALVFLFWLFAWSRRDQWLEHTALGLLFGGALGNMYDRLFNAGRVIDFIEVNLHVWPADPWPTFNVADMLLTAGVALLLVSLLGKRRQRGQEHEEGQPAHQKG